MVEQKEYLVEDLSAGAEVILDGGFQVLISDYADPDHPASLVTLPNLPFKLYRLSEDEVEVTDSDASESCKYKNGYWHTDSNSHYDFKLPEDKYEIRLETALIEMEAGANEAHLKVADLRAVTKTLACSTTESEVHRLENPLIHTPLYTNQTAIAMCLSLTPDAVIPSPNTIPNSTDGIKRFQELLNWVGFYGSYNIFKANGTVNSVWQSGSSLDGGYGGGTREGVKEFQEILHDFSDYPEDLPPPRNDGNTDGVTLLALASAYMGHIRRRRVGEPGNQGRKVNVKVLDSNCSPTVIMQDSAWHYHQFLEEVECKGGKVDFKGGGGLRSLGAKGSAGAIKASLHHTGRALDLNPSKGMQTPASDLYVLEKDVKDSKTYWKVWCRCTEQDGTRGEYKTLKGWKWKENKDMEVKGYFISITDIARKHFLLRISAHSGWDNTANDTNYSKCEWWHFQFQEGAVNWGKEMNSLGYTDTLLKRAEGWKDSDNTSPNPNVYTDNDLQSAPFVDETKAY